MFSILDRNVKVWHLLVLGLLFGVLLGSTISSAATSGSVRFASAFATDADPIHVFGNDTERVLRAQFKVPAGRVADVQTTFSATIWPNTNKGPDKTTACFGNFTLDAQSSQDNLFRPGNMELIGGLVGTLPSVGVSMTGSRKDIGPGTHYVNVYVSSVDPGCGLSDRELNVVINVR